MFYKRGLRSTNILALHGILHEETPSISSRGSAATGLGTEETLRDREQFVMAARGPSVTADKSSGPGRRQSSPRTSPFSHLHERQHQNLGALVSLLGLLAVSPPLSLQGGSLELGTVQVQPTSGTWWGQAAAGRGWEKHKRDSREEEDAAGGLGAGGGSGRPETCAGSREGRPGQSGQEARAGAEAGDTGVRPTPVPGRTAGAGAVQRGWPHLA